MLNDIQNLEDVRIKLDPQFKKEMFTKLLKNFDLMELERELEISRSMVYNYRNNRTNNVSLKLLLKCSDLIDLNASEIKSKIEKVFSRRNQIQKNLTEGANKRKQQLKSYKKDLPTIKNLFEKDSINFEKWFDKYLKLINFGCREIIKIDKSKNKISLEYANYANSKKKKFKNIFPRKIKIDEDFQYFFGLWCGDRVGKGRFGVANKDKTINLATKKYLSKLYQQPISTLHINKRIKIPKLDHIDNIYVNKSETKIKGFCIWVYSKNAILFTFFDYLAQNLNEIINLLPDKNIFFAGLFDAEGNVFLEDRVFRWACKDEQRINIYIKYLKEMDMFKRYDGGNIICNNIEKFDRNILPYLKHPQKINDTKIVCYDKGDLNKRFTEILKVVKLNNGQRMNNIAKALKKTKIYAQIKVLERLNLVKSEDYPKMIFITKKGMTFLSHGGKDKC